VTGPAPGSGVRAEAGGSGSPALERCVGDPEAFLRDHWAVRPMHRAGGRAFDDLLSLDDVDHLLTEASLRLPAFRLVKDGATLPTSGYTKSGRTGSQPVSGMADPPRVLERFRDGATIVLQGMHRYWPPLSRFCRDLEAALSHPAQVNAYITPPGSRGLAVHQDSHDVFVLQAFGKKQWDVWSPRALGDPMPGPDEEPVLSVTLAPGDAMYLPLGTPHAAATQSVLSGHLTVGILSTTWARMLTDVLDGLAGEPSFREPLPAGYHRDPAGFAAAVKDRLGQVAWWLDGVDAQAAADRRIRSFLTTRLPLLGGALTDLAGLEDVGPETAVRRRAGSFCELRVEGDRLAVFLGDRELRMPLRLEPAMRMVAAAGPGEAFPARDLPGLSDEESTVVLVRRLVREGLLEQAR